MASEVCEIKKESSTETICRLCFMERENYRLIFSDEYSSLHAWIENLTTMKIMKVPNAPASLCLECETTLQNFASFREMCFTNDRVFKELFTQDVSRSDHVTVSEAMSEINELKNYQSKEQPTDISNFVIGLQDNVDVKLECSEITTAATGTNSEDNDDHVNEKSHVIDEDQTLNTNESYMESITEWHSSNSPNKQIQDHTIEKPFICNWCNKGFKRSNQLKIHIRTHTQEKPYMCSDCKHSFSTLSNLVRHARSSNGCKPYKCNLCQARFSQDSHLVRHKLVHSRDNLGCTTIQSLLDTGSNIDEKN